MEKQILQNYNPSPFQVREEFQKLILKELYSPGSDEYEELGCLPVSPFGNSSALGK
ncbi:MAG: hypothetical protein H7A23_25465 [Leptospiraceae bacterium]|nr:hypothetical protein [Leptospiraceae bacterium]MCP5497916.1 hypothetical protein [Leptospiraceae bacterium]